MPDLDMSPSFTSVAVHFIENFLQMLVSMPEQLDCVLNAIICAGFANCIQLFSEIFQLVNVRCVMADHVPHQRSKFLSLIRCRFMRRAVLVCRFVLVHMAVFVTFVPHG